MNTRTEKKAAEVKEPSAAKLFLKIPDRQKEEKKSCQATAKEVYCILSFRIATYTNKNSNQRKGYTF
ncbi:hypothetical protein DWQ65_11345 [Treponema phagedenis]|nr:hypothetical protein HMPREF9554_02146 [Treponema phagedenis F0421]QSH94058.1 hypothetical protein C5O78_03170 [Treponema phagedenis]QSI00642.1 hypothetical protein DWQ65_11345 [Treponema phagedenis]